MEVELKHVSAVEDGDYFQIAFDADEDDNDGPYILIQRQFEDRDGGQCYVETHDARYCGHVRVKRAVLSRNTLVLELNRKHASRIHVTFIATEGEFDELTRVIQIMIPHAELSRDRAG